MGKSPEKNRINRRTWQSNEDIPIQLSDLGQPRLEFLRLSQPGPVSFESQLASMHQTAKTVREFLAEFPAQQLIIHQERLLAVSLSRVTARDPTSAVQRRSPSRDQRMNVRMMVQLLVSRVQHHQGCRMKLPFLTQHLVERLPGTWEQQVVQLTSIPQNQWRESVREREHNLEVVDSP